MISLASGLRVYLACGATDMRKGMVGLSMLVQQNLAEDPFDGAVYGSVRFGAIVTSFQTSLRASRSARQILTAPGPNVSTELLIPASLARALTEPRQTAVLLTPALHMISAVPQRSAVNSTICA